MSKHRYDHRRRPSIILDAGYVSIRANDISKSSSIIGLLHGRKLFWVILMVLILFFVSCLNFTCLIWMMYKLDWSPFYKNGSKIFRFDRIMEQVEFYHQGRFDKTIYTTKIQDLLQMNLSSEKQMDIYGDHNSILFDDHQIAMNTEYFHMNNQSLVDFTNLYLYKFDKNRTTNIHLDQINSEYIHSKYLNLSTENDLTISNVSRVLFSARNLTVVTNRNDRRSIIRFNNNPRRKNSFDHQQKTSYGNLDFRIHSLFLDLPRLPLEENILRSETGVYRLCICNTTFLLLRSFAYQPCPLC